MILMECRKSSFHCCRCWPVMLSPLARAGVGAVAPWPSSLLPQHGLGVGGGGGELLPLLPPPVEEGPRFVVGQPCREPCTAEISVRRRTADKKNCQLLIDIKNGKTKIRRSVSGSWVKGTVSWDRLNKFWQKFTELGLTKGRGWFLHFLGAPMIL